MAPRSLNEDDKEKLKPGSARHIGNQLTMLLRGPASEVGEELSDIHGLSVWFCAVARGFGVDSMAVLH